MGLEYRDGADSGSGGVDAQASPVSFLSIKGGRDLLFQV